MWKSGKCAHSAARVNLLGLPFQPHTRGTRVSEISIMKHAIVLEAEILAENNGEPRNSTRRSFLKKDFIYKNPRHARHLLATQTFLGQRGCRASLVSWRGIARYAKKAN